jgi:hypothetical protein
MGSMINSYQSNFEIMIFRKMIAVVLIAAMLEGCSYNGRLEPNLSINSSTRVKHPYTLAIDDSMLSSSQVNAAPQWFNLTVVSGDALAKSIKHQLSLSFHSVVILNKYDAKSIYDYIIAIDSKTASRCTMNSCGITTKVSMQMVDTKNMDNVIFAEDFLDVYSMHMPGGSYLINLFTGLSLFLLAPILQPISAHFAGKELMQRVSDSNDRMSFQITKEIVNSDIFEKKAE